MSVCSDGSSEVSGKTSPQQRHPAHPAMSPEPSRSLTSDLWWEQTSASAGECHPAMGLLLYACSQGCKADRDTWMVSTLHVSGVFGLGWVCGAQQPPARGYTAFTAWELFCLKRGDSRMRYLVRLP